MGQAAQLVGEPTEDDVDAAIGALAEGQEIYVGSTRFADRIKEKAPFEVDRSLCEDGYWRLKRR